MYPLALIFPPWVRFRKWLPLTRDQVMLLMAAVNEIFMGLDTYLAHGLSGTIRGGEWIPIFFGPVAGLILLVAGLLALRQRAVAIALGTLIFFASIGVGVLGTYYHLQRAVLPAAPMGQQVIVDLFFWAPPVLAPLAFGLVGMLGLSAAWIEAPTESGRLMLSKQRRLQMPFSKTRAYLFMVSVGILITLVSSVLDHARTGFRNPWLWLPLAASVFALVVTVGLSFLARPSRGDWLTYAGALGLLMGVGVVGAALHIGANLTHQSSIVFERFLRGAPLLAPLLFTNMGMLGAVVLLDPEEGEPWSLKGRS
jgi:hypothetical protein